MKAGFWWVTANRKQKYEWTWDNIYSNINSEEFFSLAKIKNNFIEIRKNDFVFGYQSSPVSAIVALAYVDEELYEEAEYDEEGIILKGIGDSILEYPLEFGIAKNVIPDSEPIRCNAQGTLFKLTVEEANLIAHLLIKNGNAIELPPHLCHINEMLDFSSNHDQILKGHEIAGKDVKQTKRQTKRTEFYESDIEKIIIERLDEIEEGLQFINNQLATDAGRIDILCKDKKGRYVIIELKRGESNDQVVGQISRYIGWAKQEFHSEDIRGIIIVRKKNKKLEYAVSSLPNVELKEYKLSIE